MLVSKLIYYDEKNILLGCAPSENYKTKILI
jgi:hypothetical protein